MSIFKRIVRFNRERKLLNNFSHEREISFIIEELLESSGGYESEEAREKALKITDELFKVKSDISEEKIIDSFADIIVYATGAIAKLKYDPEIVMDEVLKVIESRTGKIIDGKFVKDENIEVYKADFKRAKL